MMLYLLLSSLLISSTFAQEGLIGILSYTNGTFRLVAGSTANPQSAIIGAEISGIGAGQVLRSIDFRPATGALYGLATADTSSTGVATVTAYLYTINLQTGVATSTLMASGYTIGSNQVHIDFNPVADAIRIVTENNLNYRIPINGANAGVLQTDTALSYGTSTTPKVVSIAYSNNVSPAPTTTTLYAIEAALNNLVTIGGINGDPSPNGGALTVVGSTGAVTTPTGFDISGNSGVAYVSGPNGALSTVNLATGALTSNGTLRIGSDAGVVLVDLAIPFASSLPMTTSQMTSAVGVTSAASGVVTSASAGVTSAASAGVTSAASGVVVVTSAASGADVTSAASGAGVTSGAAASSEITSAASSEITSAASGAGVTSAASGVGMTSGMVMTGGANATTTGNTTTARATSTGQATTGTNSAAGLVVAISTMLVALLI